MEKHRKSISSQPLVSAARIAVLVVLAILCFTVRAGAQSVYVGQLAGPWKITLVGNTGCGQTSMLFTGTLNSSGTAAGTLTSASGCGTSSSTQTFTITSLEYAEGTGTAALSCGPGCGWSFDIQVDPGRQTFNLVDINNGAANVLAGTAVAVESTGITLAQLAAPWKIDLVGNTGCGKTSLQFTGTANAAGTAVGTLTSASGCGTSSSSQTFTITSLNAQGTGTAALSCGPGCGWNFDIQVAANRQLFNLVDVNNGGANVLAGTAVAESFSPGYLNPGTWRIAIVGNTGCGVSSMLFSGSMNLSGTAVGTLTSASRCGTSSSTQTFRVTSLNAQGTGTAVLSCGPGCGWNFDIQVDATTVFNLVDVNNGDDNVLAGTAVYQGPIFQ
jgi:hypothetical protein